MLSNILFMKKTSQFNKSLLQPLSEVFILIVLAPARATIPSFIHKDIKVLCNSSYNFHLYFLL